MKKLIILLYCLILVSACSVFSRSEPRVPRPDWVARPGLLQTDDQLIVRLGNGKSRTEAESSAKDKILSVFRGKIDAVTAEKILRSHAHLNEILYSPANHERVAELSLASDAKLHQIRFVRYWTASSREIYAAAELDRRLASRAYTDQIRSNEDRILSYLRKAVPIRDRWTRYALLHSAGIIDAYNSQLLKEFAVIDPDMRADLRPGYDPEVLATQIAEYARQLRITAITETDSLSEGLFSPLNLISQYGFSVEGSAPLTLRTTLALRLEEQRRANVYHIDYSFTIIDIEEDTLISRSGSLSYSEAKGAKLSQASKLRLRADLEAILKQSIEENLDRLSLLL